jgi:tetrahydromethanopterin S-methyltransferase subunit F
MSSHHMNIIDQTNAMEDHAYRSGFFFGGIAGFAAGIVFASLLIVAVVFFVR